MKNKRKESLHAPLLALSAFLLLTAGCAKAPGPMDVVRQFHEHAQGDQWDEAMVLIDVGAKCTTTFGELYSSAPAEDQEEMKRIWGDRLIEVTRKHLQKFFGDSLGELTLETTSETTAEVTQTKGRFSLVYSLEKREAGWIIIDRTHELDGVRPSLATGVKIVLGHIERDLGRKPTLAEVNERFLDYIGRVRTRTFKAGSTQ
jgi:hypothetical protein